MALAEPVKQKIESLVKSHDVVLFMKGNKQFPQCASYSAQVVQILDRLGAKFETFNVLSDAPRSARASRSSPSWPTIRKLYAKGEFIGGCDDREGASTLRGELAKALGVEAKPGREADNERSRSEAAKAIKETRSKTAGTTCSASASRRRSNTSSSSRPPRRTTSSSSRTG